MIQKACEQEKASCLSGLSNKTQVVVPCGYKLKTEEGYNIRERKWDPKSTLNLRYALINRHLSSRLRPDSLSIRDLRSLSNGFFTHLCQDSLSWPIEFKTIDSWLADKTSWAPIKKLKYANVILKQLTDPSEQNFRGYFTAMVKNGETFLGGPRSGESA